jgi:hypothetical protein
MAQSRLSRNPVSLFSAPKQQPVQQIIQQTPAAPSPSADLPTEDPAVTAQRKQAQAQADASVTAAIQDQLRQRMQNRLQTFGLVPVIR